MSAPRSFTEETTGFKAGRTNVTFEVMREGESKDNPGAWWTEEVVDARAHWVAARSRPACHSENDVRECEEIWCTGA